jgi:hypothetical protein
MESPERTARPGVAAHPNRRRRVTGIYNYREGQVGKGGGRADSLPRLSLPLLSCEREGVTQVELRLGMLCDETSSLLLARSPPPPHHHHHHHHHHHSPFFLSCAHARTHLPISFARSRARALARSLAIAHSFRLFRPFFLLSPRVRSRGARTQRTGTSGARTTSCAIPRPPHPLRLFPCETGGGGGWGLSGGRDRAAVGFPVQALNFE